MLNDLNFALGWKECIVIVILTVLVNNYNNQGGTLEPAASEIYSPVVF